MTPEKRYRVTFETMGRIFRALRGDADERERIKDEFPGILEHVHHTPEDVRCFGDFIDANRGRLDFYEEPIEPFRTGKEIEKNAEAAY